MDKPNLEELLKKWQAILRLQDWDIKIQYSRQFDMTSDKQGVVSWTINKKAALIKILDPMDYPTDIQWPQDVECTVVHELVHCHLAPVDDTSGLAQICLEQAVHAISLALIDRDRAPAIVKISATYQENPMGPKESAKGKRK